MPSSPATSQHQDGRLPLRAKVLGASLCFSLLLAILMAKNLIAPNTTSPSAAAVPEATKSALHLSSAQLAGLTIRPVGAAKRVSDAITATGTIQVDGNRSTPVSPPFSGLVTRLLVEPGQRVTSGQPLMAVKSTEVVEARDALASASAQHDTSLSQLKLASANAARIGEIYRTAGGALKDYQQARNEVAAAQGAERTAAAALAAARGRLGVYGMSDSDVRQLQRRDGAAATETTVRAPINGVIAKRDVAAGQFIDGKGSAAFVITDPSAVWLIAQIAERDAARVHIGDAVEVTTPAWPGRRFDARVAQVGAAIDPTTHRLPVRATIANPDGALKPDMFANFEIRSMRPGAPALLIPASAVIYEGDTARVWVEGPRGTLSPRLVTVAERNGDQVQVVSGIKSGDRLVTGGAIFVNEAAKTR